MTLFVSFYLIIGTNTEVTVRKFATFVLKWCFHPCLPLAKQLFIHFNVIHVLSVFSVQLFPHDPLTVSGSSLYDRILIKIVLHLKELHP